jgi:hypothetical protein
MLSSSDTTAMSSTSNCTPPQSEGVLVALIEEHWQAPLEQLQAPSPGTEDGVVCAETARTTHTGCACGCHAGLGFRVGRSRTRPERTPRPEPNCTELTDDTIGRS